MVDGGVTFRPVTAMNIDITPEKNNRIGRFAFSGPQGSNYENTRQQQDDLIRAFTSSTHSIWTPFPFEGGYRQELCHPPREKYGFGGLEGYSGLRAL